MAPVAKKKGAAEPAPSQAAVFKQRDAEGGKQVLRPVKFFISDSWQL